MISFLAANWVWIVLIAAVLAMHRHGGCGMHGGHHQHTSDHTDTGADDSRAERRVS